MMRTFNPDTNPYADDLMRLGLAPLERYSYEERYALARLIASKLYKISFKPPYHADAGFSSWHSDAHSGRTVEIGVIFNSDLEQHRLSRPEDLYGHDQLLIVLDIGKNGVVEVFNGVSDEGTFDQVRKAIASVRNGEYGGLADGPNATPPRTDSEVVDDYEGNREANRANRGGGRDGGGGGSDGGGGALGNASGSGGTGELINHPILFAVEEDTFDAILERV
jgi:uncharacterized membrane protein YgcG